MVRISDRTETRSPLITSSPFRLLLPILLVLLLLLQLSLATSALHHSPSSASHAVVADPTIQVGSQNAPVSASSADSDSASGPDADVSVVERKILPRRLHARPLVKLSNALGPSGFSSDMFCDVAETILTLQQI